MRFFTILPINLFLAVNKQIVVRWVQNVFQLKTE